MREVIVVDGGAFRRRHARSWPMPPAAVSCAGGGHARRRSLAHAAPRGAVRLAALPVAAFSDAGARLAATRRTISWSASRCRSGEARAGGRSAMRGPASASARDWPSWRLGAALASAGGALSRRGAAAAGAPLWRQLGGHRPQLSGMVEVDLARRIGRRPARLPALPRRPARRREGRGGRERNAAPHGLPGAVRAARSRRRLSGVSRPEPKAAKRFRRAACRASDARPAAA